MTMQSNPSTDQDTPVVRNVFFHMVTVCAPVPTAHNFGESMGNHRCLQLAAYGRHQYPTVSGYALRYALRKYLQNQPGWNANRRIGLDGSTWQDPDLNYAIPEEIFQEYRRVRETPGIDEYDKCLKLVKKYETWNPKKKSKKPAEDEYEAAKAKVEELEKLNSSLPDLLKKLPKAKKTKDVRGEVFDDMAVFGGFAENVKLGSHLLVGPAMGLSPYTGSVVTAVGSKGATDVGKENPQPTPFSYGRSISRFERMIQFSGLLHATHPVTVRHVVRTVDAIMRVGTVAGGHTANLTSYVPTGVLIRVTEDPESLLSPAFRRLGPYENPDDLGWSSQMQMRLRTGDDPGDLVQTDTASELIVGGEINEIFPADVPAHFRGASVRRAVDAALDLYVARSLGRDRCGAAA